MKFFEQANENLKRSNFYKALELFELSLKEDALSDDLRVFCCEKIEKINEILGKHATAENLLFLAQHYFDLKVFEKSESFFGKLFKETNNVFFLKKQFESLLLSGNIAEALKKANLLLDELTKRRLSNEVILFINENESLFDQLDIRAWKLRAHVLSGNIAALESELEEWQGLGAEISFELYQQALDLTAHDAKYWHSSLKISKSFWDKIANEDKSFVITKKCLIKLILDYWLTHTPDQEILRETLKIADQYTLPIVAHEIAKYVGDQDQIDKYLAMMPRSAMGVDSFDFGDDLFAENEVKASVKLERDIKFLLKSGNNAEALKLVYQLEKINPDHELVIKLINQNEEGPELGSEERYRSLITEIEKYSQQGIVEETPENQFLSLVKHYDDQLIKESYEDMIVGFNLINIPNVALEIIKKVNREDLTEREVINLDYLRIETLIAAQRFYEARDSVEDVLAETPLLKDERLAFQYLRAESYWQLGKIQIAKKLFGDISIKYPNYRLTNQRLNAIEKN